MHLWAYLTNLKEKKQEGKISGGYRYKDGKINIGFMDPSSP